MKRIKYNTASPFKYPLYICRNPRDGFIEMKANHKASLFVAFIIVVCWVFAEVFYRVATSYDMNNFSMEEISLFRTSLITIIMYVMVCVSNWCFCTLLDGKGKLKDICVVGAYALFPYVVVRVFTTLCSFVLAGDEKIFMTYIIGVTMVWCGIIAFVGLAEIHEYSFSKTIFSVFLTIVGLIIMLFIAMMLLSLFQQFYVFLTTVVMELMY